MKKLFSIIFVLLAQFTVHASLFISEAQAQSQQGYLTVTMANGQTFSLKDSDIEKMTFSTQPSGSLDHLWYVIGFDVADGQWNFSVPNSRIPLYTEDLGSGLLTYTGYFAGNGFKLVGESWVDQWGAWSNGDFVNYDGSDNIYVPTPGYYTIWLDTRNNRMWMEDGVTATAYGQISLIGSFNDWGGDLDLTRLPGVDSHDWSAEVTFAEDGEVKFRSDHDWTVNWGNNIFPSARGLNNGDNIPVKAGRYIVLFNDITGHYRFYDPANLNMETYQPLVIDDAMTVTPGETRVEFETYSEPTVQLCVGVSLPLVVDYDAVYEVSLRCGSNATVVVGTWNDTAAPDFGSIATSYLASVVQQFCGRAAVERQLDVVVTARVTVNNFPEVYTATTPITCLLPPIAYPEFVYFIGATDGWQNSEQRLQSPNFDGVYTGFVYCADPNGWGNEFKLQRRQGDWADDSQLNSNNLSTVYGDFTKGADNFIAANGEGVYYVELSLIDMTLYGKRIQNMNLVGSYNGWIVGDNTQQMTWDAEHYCFVKTGATLDNTEWKFAANDDWTINLGGSTDNLDFNAANLNANGTTVRLYPTRRDRDQIYCIVEQ